MKTWPAGAVTVWVALAVALVPLLAAPALARDESSSAGSAKVTPKRARPGDVVLVTVPGKGEEAPTVSLGERRVKGWATRRGHQLLVPVPRDAAEGPLELPVSVDGKALDPVPTITVRPRPPKDVKLEVDPRYVDPPADARQQIQADGAAVNKAYDSSSGPLDVRKPFRWPRPEVRITSRFGERRLFNGTLESDHEGTDLSARQGEPVRAANEGTVALSRDLFHSGNTIIIDHGGRVFTAYFHLSSLEAKEGQRVRHGEQIGRTGSTGRSTAPHVHFAVNVAGTYVDPESFMRLRLERLRGAPGAPERPTAAREGN